MPSREEEHEQFLKMQKESRLKQQEEYLAFQQEHKGHEQQHRNMALILFFALFFSQIGIQYWKKNHPKSFNWMSLLGLFFVPPILALKAGNTRFIVFWILFSLGNVGVIRLSTQKPLKSSTPGTVYKFYSIVYSASYFIGLLGYFITIMAFFRIPEIVLGVGEMTEVDLFQTGLTLMFYGLYFGALGRDFVARLSEYMATSLGYYNRKGFPSKHLRDKICAICGTDTDSSPSGERSQEATERKGTLLDFVLIGGTAGDKAYKLNCGHVYHESCVRGWTIIGKQDCCPYCKEKVDLKEFKGSNPWETTQLLFLNLIDVLMYLVVWNPIVFFIVHEIFLLMGLD